MLLKKDFRGRSPSNIDSRRILNVQDRFKKSLPMIRLLRTDGMPPIFFNRSTQTRHRRSTQFKLILDRRLFEIVDQDFDAPVPAPWHWQPQSFNMPSRIPLARRGQAERFNAGIGL
jgi:hypothetical protein